MQSCKIMRLQLRKSICPELAASSRRGACELACGVCTHISFGVQTMQESPPKEIFRLLGRVLYNNSPNIKSHSWQCIHGITL